jgi:hypothetical protein
VPGPLRIFISSTMRDLANERADVIERLRAFNFEPVNAEAMMPNGNGSWDRLEPEIRSSDVFVLILGETYGWIPETGPMSGSGKSVTELEFDIAKETGLPVLAFVKRLAIEAPTDTEDARRRDAFRQRVGDWDGGLFRTEFDLASDLSEKVGRALILLLTDRFRARLDEDVRETGIQDAGVGLPPTMRSAVRLPADLVDAVASRQAILLLGAGASLEAGMPSAAAFIDAMVERIHEIDPAYRPVGSGTLFNAVATDFESLLGRDNLSRLAEQLVNSPYLGGPTEAHGIAGRLFDTVVTTNYDLLLEKALDAAEQDGGQAGSTRGPRIIKLHGSIDRPDGLVLTEADLASLERRDPVQWSAVSELLRSRPVLSIGSSLRDPSVVRLLEAVGTDLRGWVAVPQTSEAERVRLARWGLDMVEGSAYEVLSALERAVRRRQL